MSFSEPPPGLPAHDEPHNRGRIGVFILVAMLAAVLVRAECNQSVSAQQTHITMVYSAEKGEWIRFAARRFEQAHPEINIALAEIDSIRAAQLIGQHRVSPTVWSPADSSALELADDYWRRQHERFCNERHPRTWWQKLLQRLVPREERLYTRNGDDSPTLIAETPLVFVARPSAAEKLAIPYDGHPLPTLQWSELGRAVRERGLALSHTDPRRSSSALNALYLMGLEFNDYPLATDIGADTVPAWMSSNSWLDDVVEIERGVREVGLSSGTLIADMLSEPTPQIDLVITYESAAIAALNGLQSPNALRIYYPNITYLSDQPVVLLHQAGHCGDGDGWTASERQAAREWIHSLLSPEIQSAAFGFGMRARDLSQSCDNPNEAGGCNQFARLGGFGVRWSLPPRVFTANGAELEALLQLWGRGQLQPPGGLSDKPLPAPPPKPKSKRHLFR